MKTHDLFLIPKHAKNMNLRDYYAGQALAGMLARRNSFDLSDEADREELASAVWLIADAMIENRYATSDI